MANLLSRQDHPQSSRSTRSSQGFSSVSGAHPCESPLHQVEHQAPTFLSLAPDFLVLDHFSAMAEPVGFCLPPHQLLSKLCQANLQFLFMVLARPAQPWFLDRLDLPFDTCSLQEPQGANSVQSQLWVCSMSTSGDPPPCFLTSIHLKVSTLHVNGLHLCKTMVIPDIFPCLGPGMSKDCSLCPVQALKVCLAKSEDKARTRSFSSSQTRWP